MQAEYEAKMKFKNFKRTNTYKDSGVYNKIVSYIFLITGLSIIIGAFYGIIHNGIYSLENGHQIINLNQIVTVISITIVGTILIIFSRINIRMSN